jgi:hypothetical protein
MGLTLLSAWLVATAVFAESTAPSHEIGAMGGGSIRIFGSSERLASLGAVYGISKPEPRFGSRKVPADLVTEGYGEFSSSSGDIFDSPYSRAAVGGLALSRWYPKSMFVDLGVGLQWNSKLSRDISSSVNSTPVLDVGLRHGAGNRELLYGIRYMHISNANTKRPNRGQNQFLFYVVVQSF